MPLVKPWWLIVSFASGFLFAMWAEDLAVHWRNDEIHVTAPKLHFLSGQALNRLKNGAAVPYDFQLSVWTEQRPSPIGRVAERFVISYDLWEEKYSVTKIRPNAPLREGLSISHLSAAAAENWCVDHIAVPAAGLSGTQPFRVKLEVRTVEPKQAAGVMNESGVSLSRLIDVFTHPVRPDQQRWALEAGPFKLDDVRRSVRGS